jgi:hypothetical protein
MHAGKIEAQGTYDELISTKSNLIQSLAASTESSEVEGETTEVCTNLKSLDKSLVHISIQFTEEKGATGPQYQQKKSR